MRSNEFTRYVSLKIEQHKNALRRAAEARRAGKPARHAYHLKQCACIRYVLQKDLSAEALYGKMRKLLPAIDR